MHYNTEHAMSLLSFFALQNTHSLSPRAVPSRPPLPPLPPTPRRVAVLPHASPRPLPRLLLARKPAPLRLLRTSRTPSPPPSSPSASPPASPSTSPPPALLLAPLQPHTTNPAKPYLHRLPRGQTRRVVQTARPAVFVCDGHKLLLPTLLVPPPPPRQRHVVAEPGLVRLRCRLSQVC